MQCNAMHTRFVFVCLRCDSFRHRSRSVRWHPAQCSAMHFWALHTLFWEIKFISLSVVLIYASQSSRLDSNEIRIYFGIFSSNFGLSAWHLTRLKCNYTGALGKSDSWNVAFSLSHRSKVKCINYALLLFFNITML